MQRIDDQRDRHFKICIYGDPGTGKTFAGVSAPEPLILLSERQGLEHIREAAQFYDRPMPPVLYMSDLGDYGQAIRALNGDRNGPFVVHDNDGVVVYESEHWPQTVVLDSLTDAMTKVKIGVFKQSPPKPANDGLDEPGMRHWGAIRQRCERLVWAFRDLPMHVVFLCLRKDTDGDENTTRSTGPDTPMRALPGTIVSSVNLCGVSARVSSLVTNDEGNAITDDDGRPVREYRYVVHFRGPEHAMFKPSHALKTIEAPRIDQWIETLTKEGN